MTQNDPFIDAPLPTSAFPKVRDFEGHLVLFTPTKLERGIPSNFRDKQGNAQLQDRITTDVVVLDGPLDDFEDTEYDALWISNDKIVNQLSKAVKTGSMVLARVTLPDPKKAAGVGNAWQLSPPNDDDRKVARQYLASKKEEDPFAV